ncbi:hypothetical protein HY745_12495 [Candidatus Desantisbacteria bacterium]|nr:hypothetical protein [Candidatus Desantisbacteria bacterium]
MKRTTIFTEEKIFTNIKHIAQEENLTISEIIRQALEKFINDRYKSKKKISFINAGKSGKKDISEKYKELLWRKN